MTHVISRNELQRMRQSVREPVISNTEARRKQLKELSDSRVAHWPNTLEASRRKKDNWKREKLQAEELERQRVDREEAELQKRLRIEAIKRANTILYEQTDKMKNLRSQQMYMEVLSDRERQIERKQKRQQEEWKRDEDYDVVVLEQLKVANAKAEAEEAAVVAKNRNIARLQLDQLAEYRNQYLEAMQQERAEGELLAKKCEADLLEDADKQAEQMTKAKVAAEEMLLENERLKLRRKEALVFEQQEAEKREAEMKKKEDLAARRKAMEAMHFAEKQAVKQRLIDRATEQMAARLSSENHRLERQVEEARVREENVLAAKAERRARQMAAIDQSRTLQLDMRRKAAAAEAEESTRLAQHYADKARRMEEDEAAEALALRTKQAGVLQTQKAQILEKHQWREAAREAEMRANAQAQAVMAEDDARYHEIAAKVVDDAVASGKNVVPVRKALNAKVIDLLPASVGRL